MSKDKNKIVRLYLWISMAYIVVLGFVQNSFNKGLMGEESSISGIIEKTIFKYNFSNIALTIEQTNVPMILYIIFAVMTIVVAVYALRQVPVKQKLIQDVLVYNGIIALLLIVSNVVFMMMLPETVSGIIEHSLIMSKVPMQGGSIANVYNFMYIFMIAYIILNIVVLQMTKEKSFKKENKEQNLDSEFLL